MIRSTLLASINKATEIDMKSLTEFMLTADSKVIDWDGYAIIENKPGSLVIESPKGSQFIFTKESNSVNLAITDGNSVNMFKVPLEVYKLMHRKIK